MCYACGDYPGGSYSDGGGMYSYFAPSSRAAQRREKECKVEFHKVKSALERSFLHFGPHQGKAPAVNDTDSPLGAMTVSQKAKEEPIYVFKDIIPPSQHLTSVTYPSFRKLVEENHPGWKVFRRSVEKEEMDNLSWNKKRLGKGKSYFIGFSYQKDAPPPKPRSKKVTRKSIEEGHSSSPSIKKAKIVPLPVEEDDKKPAASPRATSFHRFAILPDQVQVHIIGYCDVPTLGCALLTNKSLHAVAKQDQVWESHLQHMLQFFFDDSVVFATSTGYFSPSLKDPATPLTQRNDWRQSTALLKWWNDPRASLLLPDGDPKNAATTGSPDSPRDCTKITNTAPARMIEYISNYLSHRSISSIPARIGFMLKDVSLRQYYLGLGSLIYEYSRTNSTDFLWEGTDFSNECCKHCFGTVPAPNLFKGLPKIFWHEVR